MVSLSLSFTRSTLLCPRQYGKERKRPFLLLVGINLGPTPDNSYIHQVLHLLQVRLDEVVLLSRMLVSLPLLLDLWSLSEASSC